MGHKEGGSLYHQLLQSPGLMTNANRERNGKPVTNSYQTQANYRDWLHRASDFFKGHGIRRAEEITPERVQQYADHLQAQGYSASTVHSYLAPLCKARGIPMGDISKPIRTAADFSKGAKTSAIPPSATAAALADGRRPTPSELNACLGFRASELLRLRPSDLHETPTGDMYVVLDRGKGGKEQWQHILPAHRDTVRAAFAEARGSAAGTSGGDSGASGGTIYHKADMGHGINYQAQRRAMAREALDYYSQRLATDPAYRKELYGEVATQWHHLNHRDRGDLPPLSYFDRPYCLRGDNKALAEEQGQPTEWDRLALRAVSVLHLAHWRDNITIQAYYHRR